MTISRSFWIWLGAIVGGALVLTCAFALDPFVRNWILEHQHRGTKQLMRAITRFGDWPSHTILGVLLLAVAWWRGSNKWRRIFLSMLVACALAGAATRVVKIAAGRARPSVQSEIRWSGPSFTSKNHAFPSGHAAASTAFFTALVIGSWRIGAAFMIVPAVIAFSRLYLDAHYLSDVVAGAFVGVLSALIVSRIAARPKLARERGG